MADKARPHTPFRSWAALVLLAVLVACFALLGKWQLNRAALRDRIRHDIEAAARHQPLALDSATPASELIAWRQARVKGQWLHSYTVLLENRNHQGHPGYWVATPLQLATTAARPDTSDESDLPGSTILVLRGWLARDTVMPQAKGTPLQAAGLRDHLARPDGILDVSGHLLAHVPRIFELWSRAGHDANNLPSDLNAHAQARQGLPVVQNIGLEEFRQATSLDLLPAVLAQSSSDLDMIQDWPGPSLDADTNRGYALQWFSFCLIAAGAWLWTAWRLFRSRHTRIDTQKR